MGNIVYRRMMCCRYAAACKQANDWIDAVLTDPMGKYAPVDEIIEGYMRKHVVNCEPCREATFQANMP